MYAMQQPATIRNHEISGAQRPVSTRAAFGIWAMASVGGWLVIAGLLRALGIL
jgi:hypothetical protein